MYTFPKVFYYLIEDNHDVYWLMSGFTIKRFVSKGTSMFFVTIFNSMSTHSTNLSIIYAFVSPFFFVVKIVLFITNIFDVTNFTTKITSNRSEARVTITLLTLVINALLISWRSCCTTKEKILVIGGMHSKRST